MNPEDQTFRIVVNASAWPVREVRISGRGSANRDDAGFTLVELLAVIGTIALLSLLLLPALAGARSDSKAFQCLNNLRQIQHGWLLYSADNRDQLLPTVGQGGLQVQSTNSVYCQPGNAGNQWIYGDMSTFPAALNQDLIRVGLIYPYVPNVAAFKCPADKKAAINGVLTVRSISMNGYMNPLNAAAPPTPALTPPAPLTALYRLFKKQNDLGRLGAANTWVLIEESPISINDSWFCTDPRPTAITWIDKPATYHNNACGLSFADGHAEMKKWKDQNLINWKGPPLTGLPVQPGAGDLQWLGQRSSAR